MYIRNAAYATYADLFTYYTCSESGIALAEYIGDYFLGSCVGICIAIKFSDGMVRNDFSNQFSWLIGFAS